MSLNPFDPFVSPVSTPEVEREIAARHARELDGKAWVQCVACGAMDVDHGGARPHCKTCRRVRTYGTIVDGFLAFVFGGEE